MEFKETLRNSLLPLRQIRVDMAVTENILQPTQWSLTSYNTSGNVTEETKVLSTTTYDIVYAVFKLALASVIIFGNCLVSLSVIMFKRMQSVTNLLILNLAISDISVSLALIFNAISEAMLPRQHWTYPYMFSRIFYNVGLPTSFITLVAIAIDRNVAVTRPLKYKMIITKFRVKIAIGLIWMYTMTFNIPITVYFALPLDHTLIEYFFLSVLPFFVLIVYSAHIMLGLFLNFALYTQILYKLWSQKKKIDALHRRNDATNHGAPINQEGIANSRTRRVTKMMILVVATLLICWFPYVVVTNAVELNNDLVNILIYDTSIFIMSSYSAINPIIYYTRGPEFKKAFRKILKLKDKENVINVEPTMTTTAH